MTTFAMDEKIVKLLNKAESATPAEAEILTAKAEELMIKFGVEQALIDAKRRSAGQVRTEQIIRESLHFVGVYQGATILAGHHAATALGTLRTYKHDGTRDPETGLKSTTLFVVGFESDVHQAMLLIRSLQLQCATAMNTWWTDVKHLYGRGDGYRARRTFMIAFGDSAATRIRESRRRVISESRGTSAEVALRDRLSLVDESMRDLHLARSRSGAWKPGSRFAFDAGREAGRHADVGQTRLTGGHTAISH